MLAQILWAMLYAAATVMLHCVYSVRLINALRKQSHIHLLQSRASMLRIYILLEAVLMLLLLHTLETALWAGFYYWHPNGLPDFATAFYFSLTSYTTIGYGDVLLPKATRLIGAMEGVVGTLMFGWSVALLAAILQKAVAHPQEKTQ